MPHRRHLNNRTFIQASLRQFSTLKRMKPASTPSLSRSATLTPEIEACHAEAVRNRSETYTDPHSGLMVFTELAALRRGYCCGKGCRHCPYGHFAVMSTNRGSNNAPREIVVVRPSPSARRPSSSTSADSTPAFLDGKLLFFSGGTKSTALLERAAREDADCCGTISAITTFDSSTGMVDETNDLGKVMDRFQEVLIPRPGSRPSGSRGPTTTIKRNWSLTLVPLPPAPSNEQYLGSIQEAVRKTEVSMLKGEGNSFRAFVFGDDGAMPDIMEWKRKTMGGLRGDRDRDVGDGKGVVALAYDVEFPLAVGDGETALTANGVR